MASGPYEKLFIYELAGPLPVDKQAMGPDFLADWQEGGYTFLFFKAGAAAVTAQFAASHGAEVRSETVVDYTDWEAGRPVEATLCGRVLVCPTWDARTPAPGQVRVLMDPGVAFGTGHHPTTARCLAVLSSLYERATPATVLDLGCGTGVLTAAALQLGACSATAVDYQESTVETAMRTFTLNELSTRVSLHHGAAADYAQQPADLLCCNIFIQVIEQLIAPPDFFNKKWYLFSGLYASHADQVLDTLTAAGLRLAEHHIDEKWNTILAERP